MAAIDASSIRSCGGVENVDVSRGGGGRERDGVANRWRAQLDGATGPLTG
jgi:hypothetical protein